MDILKQLNDEFTGKVVALGDNQTHYKVTSVEFIRDCYSFRFHCIDMHTNRKHYSTGSRFDGYRVRTDEEVQKFRAICETKD